jgi:alkanesulfonate monooxygenase SsuD/methylene tetrahydromethanopterin reductase-like flavin-dependent oxidoreductase (luciferase family)
MLRLTARYADIWNARGGPEEAGAGNRKLDELCAEEGRDPAAIVRGDSPARNFRTSVAAFEEHFAAYRAEGFTDFEIPWPRTPEELPVLRQLAREVIPKLR